jgi:hypothetical protein
VGGAVRLRRSPWDGVDRRTGLVIAVDRLVTFVSVIDYGVQEPPAGAGVGEAKIRGLCGGGRPGSATPACRTHYVHGFSGNLDCDTKSVNTLSFF